MEDTTITSREFERRITTLCVGGVGPGLPRRRRDRHIILKSIALLLGHERVYTEPELNAVIQSWLAAVGPSVLLDHVSLRRHLVDEGYVVRDPAGREYRVCPSREWWSLFEPAVDDVDVLGAVRSTLAEREERRRRQGDLRSRKRD